MKKKHYIKIIIVIVIVGVLAFLLKPSEEGQNVLGQSDETASYQTTAPKVVHYAEEVTAVGTLSNKDEYQLSFMVGGIVSYLKVNEGDRVSEGEVLARINQTSVKAMTDRINLAYEKAERDFKRTEALYKDGVITLEEYQNAKTGLESNRLQLKDAEFSLEFSIIKAPASGIIHSVLINENEMTSAGSPVISMGAEKQGKVLKANITDVDIVKIKLGNKAQIYFDAFPENIFKGHVSEIAGMADKYTGTYEIEVLVNDYENILKSGFIGKVIVKSDNEHEYCQIPVEALVEADEMQGKVYILNEDKKSLRTVKIQKIVGDKLLISDGLEGTEQIVIN